MTSMRLPTLTAPWAAVVLAVCAALQAVYNTTLPLSGDEAYYWVWAHTLQAGYHDHPPGIAVLIALTTALFGDSVFAVRLVAVLCMTGAIAYIRRTARDVYGEPAATLALVLALALPATEAGFTLATPDSPLVLFWSAAVFHARRAVAGEGRWRDFLLAGLFVGLAMASKYTAVLLPGAVAVYLAARRRDLLLSGRTWAAVAVAAAVFSPVLAWNISHGLESFAFQYKHGSGAGFAIRWDHMLEFVGGQFLLVSPVLFAVLALRAAVWRGWWRDEGPAFLMAVFLLPLAFFLYKSLFAKIQLNWAVPVYVSAIPPLADFLLRRDFRRTAVAGVGVALLMTAILKWPLAFGLTGKLNPHNRLHGPATAAAVVAELRRPGDALFADHLQRASLLRFLLADHPSVHIPTQSRFSEYTRWDWGLDFRAMHGLYLSTDDRLAELRRVFGSAELLKEVVAARPGYRTETYYVYRVGGPG